MTTPPLRRILTVSMLSRLVHDVAVRLVYPFMPEIAKGLGVSIDQLGALVSLRNGIGISGPVFGAMSDRIGHRRAMTLGLLVLSIGLAIVGVSEGIVVPAIGLVLAGIGSAIYVPTLQAYVSERVPYQQRGRVLGAIELTWAAAGMVGVPVMGVLIGSLGWRAPFIGLAVGAFACSLSTLLLEETPRNLARAVNPSQGFKFSSLLHHKSALAFMFVWLLVFFAFENIQVSYGSWLEKQFGLSAADRGGTQTLFGLFEIAASAGSSAFLDRIGKKRGVTGGLIVVAIGYVMLASIASQALPLALISISIAFLGFEFSVVSGIPIMSEQMPEARGTMLALGVMASSVGRMIADLTGSALTEGAGFTIAALVSLAAGAMTVIVFVLGVKEHATQ
jgi:predicted MFS family arabinose efflux permease